MGVADLARLARSGATALGRPYPDDSAVAIDRIERELALVASGRLGAARHLAGPDSFLARSLAQDTATWERGLTPWDGVIDVAASPEAVSRLRLAGQRSSASAVQAFAGCPYRHLLQRGLNLKAWEEPERAYQIEGKHFGTLYHAVAHRLFAELAEERRLPIREEALDALTSRVGSLIEDELMRFAAEGGIVNAALLDPVRVRLQSDLEEMLRGEVQAAKDGDGFVPTDFEREFADLEVALSPGASITFRGTIDRIDVEAGSGRVRVIDYKTGKYYWGKDEHFKGGRELQLAIYNRAARALFPKKEISEAVYYYATAAGDYKRKACPATPEVDRTLTDVLTALDGMAVAGVFPPVADTCTFCDFKTVCGTFREQRAARKADDPRLAAFRRLREIP